MRQTTECAAIQLQVAARTIRAPPPEELDSASSLKRAGDDTMLLQPKSAKRPKRCSALFSSGSRPQVANTLHNAGPLLCSPANYRQLLRFATFKIRPKEECAFQVPSSSSRLCLLFGAPLVVAFFRGKNLSSEQKFNERCTEKRIILIISESSHNAAQSGDSLTKGAHQLIGYHCSSERRRALVAQLLASSL